jgi:hypothetical protein
MCGQNREETLTDAQTAFMLSSQVEFVYLFFPFNRLLNAHPEKNYCLTDFFFSINGRPVKTSSKVVELFKTFRNI